MVARPIEALTMTAQRALPTTGNYQHADVIAPAVSPSVEYRALFDGDAGTFQTLDAMRDAVLGLIPPDYSGYLDPFNIRAANNICAGSPGQEEKAQIAALFNWVIGNITYQEHPFNQQVVQDARRTIELGAGDCVSLSVLLATLAACLGYQSQFVAQWLDGESASHVYLEVFMPTGETLALDAVASDEPMGWRQPTLDGGFEVAWEIFNG
jgi:transglutaminase-like putative cysteine protease